MKINNKINSDIRLRLDFIGSWGDIYRSKVVQIGKTYLSDVFC